MSVRYTKDHEWISIEGDIGTVGISEYAQEALGDVVYVEVPQPGSALARGGEAGVVESVKAASEIYAPVSGEIVEGNAALESDPALLNTAPMTSGWMFKIKLSDPSELDGLMNEEGYAAFVKELS